MSYSFRSRGFALSAILLLWGCIYCGLALTPSSYGIILEKIHSTEVPLMGVPQGIRSDEHSLFTPLLQIMVRNEFARYNATSPYNEDLRAYIMLPLKDWALVFKPTFWAFYVLPPANAYSFYYYASFLLFLCGYFLLFQRIGLGFSYALLASCIAYLSSFTQHWYAISLGQLAWFPWLLLACLYSGKSWLKIIIVYYVAGAFLFSSIYTPGVVPLAYASLWLFIAFFRDSLKPSRLWPVLLACSMAGATYIAYNSENLVAIANTIYPGQRHLQAGILPLGILLEFLFPGIVFLSGGTLQGANICEASAYASYLALMLLFFVKDWRLLVAEFSQNKKVQILAAGLGILLVWMVVPLPEPFVQLLLMHKIPPERWLFAFGLLWHVLLFILLVRVPFEITRKRIIAFSSCVLLVTFLVKLWWSWNAIAYAIAAQDYMIIPIFLLVIKYCDQVRDQKLIVLIAVTLSNALSFGLFNPWQSAKLIFPPPETAYLEENRVNPDYFTKEGYYVGPTISIGTANNGLGLRSIAHALMVPQIAFFESYFDKCLTKEQLNTIFNRYAHIILYDKGDMYHSWLSTDPDRFDHFQCVLNKNTWDIYATKPDVTPSDAILLPRDFWVEKNH